MSALALLLRGCGERKGKQTSAAGWTDPGIGEGWVELGRRDGMGGGYRAGGREMLDAKVR